MTRPVAIDDEVRQLNSELVGLLAKADDTPMDELPAEILERIRAIGRRHDERGGLCAMQHAYRTVKKMGPARGVSQPALVALNAYWHGVADWRM